MLVTIAATAAAASTAFARLTLLAWRRRRPVFRSSGYGLWHRCLIARRTLTMLLLLSFSTLTFTPALLMPVPFSTAPATIAVAP